MQLQCVVLLQVLSVMSCYGMPYLMFHVHSHKLDKMTGAWLLPVVSALSAFHQHKPRYRQGTVSGPESDAQELPVPSLQVPTVVAAASGAVLAPYLSPQDAVTTILTSYALLGSGLGMSLLVLAMYVHRLAICHLPEAEVCFSAAADLLPLNPLVFTGASCACTAVYVHACRPALAPH